jgi:hypothetical protein
LPSRKKWKNFIVSNMLEYIRKCVFQYLPNSIGIYRLAYIPNAKSQRMMMSQNKNVTKIVKHVQLTQKKMMPKNVYLANQDIISKKELKIVIVNSQVKLTLMMKKKCGCHVIRTV